LDYPDSGCGWWLGGCWGCLVFLLKEKGSVLMPLVAIQPQPGTDQLIKAAPLMAAYLGDEGDTFEIVPSPTYPEYQQAQQYNDILAQSREAYASVAPAASTAAQPDLSVSSWLDELTGQAPTPSVFTGAAPAPSGATAQPNQGVSDWWSELTGQTPAPSVFTGAAPAPSAAATGTVAQAGGQSGTPARRGKRTNAQTSSSGDFTPPAYVSPQAKAAQAQAQLEQRLKAAQGLKQPVKSSNIGTIVLIGVGVVVLGVAAMAAFKFSK
jgi:hypothetical protein